MIKLKKADEAKARNFQKVKGILSGKNDLVKTWGIITAENPLGVNFPASVNAARDKALRTSLANKNLEYIKVKGKYGNPENSLFIINPSLKDMEKIASDFCQESFIFAVNTEGDSFVFDAGYYEIEMDDEYKDKVKDKLIDNPEYKMPKTFTYKKSITKNRIIDQKDADDFFTSIKTHGRNFKFQIPFFEATVREAFDRISMCVEGKDRDHVVHEILRTTIKSSCYTEGSIWRIRGLLYKA